jgi:hypothetical protein
LAQEFFFDTEDKRKGILESEKSFFLCIGHNKQKENIEVVSLELQ